jgi:hypothetical protein
VGHHHGTGIVNQEQKAVLAFEMGAQCLMRNGHATPAQNQCQNACENGNLFHTTSSKISMFWPHARFCKALSPKKPKKLNPLMQCATAALRVPCRKRINPPSNIVAFPTFRRERKIVFFRSAPQPGLSTAAISQPEIYTGFPPAVPSRFNNYHVTVHSARQE